MKTSFAQRGVSLVEALVALVVMSVGMLGIASLYVTSLQTGRSALVRTQAVNIVNDLADRIRANSLGRSAYGTSGFDSQATAPNCLENTCTPEQLAKSDLSAWIKSFNPSDSTDSTDSYKPLPPGTVGTVEYKAGANGSPDWYQIELQWHETGQSELTRYFVSLELVPVQQ